MKYLVLEKTIYRTFSYLFEFRIVTFQVVWFVCHCHEHVHLILCSVYKFGMSNRDSKILPVEGHWLFIL